MATKINVPIPQDKIGESFVWRDWFQKLSNKVYGSLASQDSSNVSITGGAIDGTTIGATTPSTGNFTSLTSQTLFVDSGTDGQVLIGKTSDHSFTPANLTAGTNINIVTGPSSVTISALSASGFAALDGVDGEDGMPIPGPRGATGATGATGLQGLTGVPVYLEAEQGEDGTMGPPGLTGLTGSQGPMGVAVFLEADAGEQGDMGPPGLTGITGAQGPIGPAVYLEAPEADEPMFTGGPTVPVNGSLTWSVPVTKTADFTLGVFETYVINNKTAATCTVTLPSASAYPGRPINFQNYQAQTLVSASSNVVPIAGGAAGTAILAASVGDTTTLISDGTNWIQVKYESNNNLLLE